MPEVRYRRITGEGAARWCSIAWVRVRSRSGRADVSAQSGALAAGRPFRAGRINRRWGRYRVTIPDPWVQTLRLRGYDATAERGVYEYIFRGLRRVQDLASRWQVEVSVRYVF